MREINAPRISVIIPCYNAAVYLERCVRSLYEQTFADFEVIVVDDCSTDGSRELLEELSVDCPLRAVLSQENQGAAASRNQGIRLARGEFLFFMDADDYLDNPRALELLLACAEEEQADIVVGNYRRKTGDRVFPVVYHEFDRNTDTSSVEFRFRGFYSVGNLAYVWAKLYRRSFLLENELTMKPVPYSEDKLFNIDCYLREPVYGFVEEAVYVYSENQASLSHQYKPEFDRLWLSLAEEMNDSLLQAGKQEDCFDFVAFQLFYGLFLCSKQEYEKEGGGRREIRAMIRSFQQEPLMRESLRWFLKSPEMKEIGSPMWELSVKLFAVILRLRLVRFLAFGIGFLIDYGVDQDLSVYREADDSSTEQSEEHREERRQLRQGTALNYVNLVLTVVIGILTIPVLIRGLGDSHYGLYQLIGSFVGYLGVMDFGLGTGLIWYLTRYRLAKDRAGEENFLGMAIVLYSFIAAAAFGIGMVCYLGIDVLFRHSFVGDEMLLAQKMFLILLANLVIQLLQNVFPSILTAYERFVFLRWVEIAYTLVRGGGIIAAILVFHADVLTVVWINFLVNVTAAAVRMAYVFLKLKVRIRLHHFDGSLVKSLFNYSSFVFLNLVVSQIYWQIDQLILGVAADMATVTVAIYSTGTMLAMYYMQFSNVISGLFLPKITKMVERQEGVSALTDVMIRLGRLQTAVLTVVTIGFLVFGDTFVTLLAGEGYHRSYVIAMILIAAMFIPIVENTGMCVLQAMNRHRFAAVMLTGVAVCNTLITIAVVKPFGSIGAALATAGAFIIGDVLILNWYYSRRIGLEIGRFFRECFRGLPFLAAGTLAAGLVIDRFGGEGFGTLCIKGVLLLSAYGLLLWNCYFDKEEKKKLLGLFFKDK